MDAHTPAQAPTRALVRAGLVDPSGKPLSTLHGLRHTCGSIPLARGVPLIVVSRHLGHADPNITARVYAHLLTDNQLDQVADIFASLAEPEVETPRQDQQSSRDPAGVRRPPG
jgi:integrase